MSKKTISASIEVEVDDEVTPKMIRDILENHLYFAFSDTAGGTIYWDRVKLFVAGYSTKLTRIGTEP